MRPHARFDGAPRLSGPLSSIVRVEGCSPQEWVILSHRMSPLWVHYHGESKRSYPCTSSDPLLCIWDHRVSRSQFCGWIAVQGRYSRRLQFLSLTESCIRDNPLMLAEDADLRGRVLTVARRGGSCKGRMVAQLSDSQVDQRTLLKGGNMLNFLKAVYGLPCNWPVDPARWNSHRGVFEEFWSNLIGDGGDA